MFAITSPRTISLNWYFSNATHIEKLQLLKEKIPVGADRESELWGTVSSGRVCLVGLRMVLRWLDL